MVGRDAKVVMGATRHKSGRRTVQKHGLYAKRLSREEAEVLEAQEVEDVEGEIALQRALIGRLTTILAGNGLGPSDREALTGETQRTVKLLKAVMSELRHYIRMHAERARRLNDPTREIEDGKNLVRQRRNVFRYLEEEEEPPTNAG